MPRKKGPPKKMGRPKKNIDWDKFDDLCALQCTLIECALDLKVDPHTLNEKIKEKFDGLTFAQVFKTKRMAGVLSLRRRIRNVAYRTDNPTLLIWSDKKYAHIQGDVDPRAFGGKAEDALSVDRKIDINVTYVETPPDAMKEKFDFENTEECTDESK